MVYTPRHSLRNLEVAEIKIDQSFYTTPISVKLYTDFKHQKYHSYSWFSPPPPSFIGNLGGGGGGGGVETRSFKLSKKGGN